MAFVTTHLWIPEFPGSRGYTLSGFTLDGAAEKWAFIFQAPKAGTLDKFEFRLSTVTQAPANGLRASLQTVSGVTGDPDGVQDQFRDITSGLTASTWITPGLMTSDGTDSGTKRTVTQGEILAAVVEFTLFSAGDSLQISTQFVTNQQMSKQFPYEDIFGAAWTKDVTAYPVMALKYNDGSYGYTVAYPISAFNAPSFNPGSTPDERGLIFQLPFKAKIGGFWWGGGPGGITGDTDVVLYDASSTALVTHNIDAMQRAAVTNNFYSGRFSSDVEIAANTTYRLVIKPLVDNVVMRDFDVPSAAHLDAVEGGQTWHYTQRTDAGAWTETTTKRPFLGLRITAVDDGAGGAAARGGLRPLGMRMIGR